MYTHTFAIPTSLPTVFRWAVCCFLSTSSIAFAAEADRFAAVQVVAQPVGGNVYMLTGAGGNIGVSVGEDGTLIIDDQFAPLAERIQQAIDELGGDKPKIVLNTHFHGDHVGGNKALGQDTPIIAHENARKRLLGKRDTSDEAFRNSLPWITFDDDLSLHFNGEEIEIVHFPTGHTDTDCVLFFSKSNVVHMGDHFFNGRFPFIDLAGGGDVASYIDNVQTIIDRLPTDVKIIPGHGPLATLDDLKAFKAMLDETVGIIRDGIGVGKDEDKLQAEGLPDKYAEAGTGFVNTKRWIAIVFESLTR